MGRVRADHGLCQGYGICADEAPMVFGLDDDGMVIVKNDFSASEREQVGTAVRDCPTSALSIIEE